MTQNNNNKESFAQAGKTFYLTNKELLAAVIEAKQKGFMTDKLARMLQLLCSKYAKKGSFVNYSYNDDMQSYAMMMLVRTWHNFNPEKTNNPFAFFTQCIKNSFIQYLNQERRQRTIRDQMLIDQGMNPSFSYNESSNDGIPGIEDEQDFDSMREIADLLKRADADEPIERDDNGDEIINIPIDDDDLPPVDVTSDTEPEEEN